MPKRSVTYKVPQRQCIIVIDEQKRMIIPPIRYSHMVEFALSIIGEVDGTKP